MAGKVTHVTDLNWHLPHIGAAMGLSEAFVSDCLKDGRSAVFFVTRKLATTLPGFGLVPSAQVKHALTDARGVWAVKCISTHGVDISKSKMRGVGRTFNQAEFEKMLAQLAGFFMADIVDFPRVPVWQINKEAIQTELKRRNTLGAAISRNEILHWLKNS